MRVNFALYLFRYRYFAYTGARKFLCACAALSEHPLTEGERMGELCDVDTKRRCCCFLGKLVLVFVFVSQMKDTQLGHSSVLTPLVQSIGSSSPGCQRSRGTV